MIRALIFLLTTAAIVCVLVFGALWMADRKPGPTALVPLTEPLLPIRLDAIDPVATAKYVGSPNCVECHKDQYDLWLNSHHDLAMKVANDETVLGDFDDAEFVYTPTKNLKEGQEIREVTRFYREGRRFLVETLNEKGDLQEYEVLYTFGWTPLQQYLVDTGDGKLQCLPFAWDAREKGTYKDMDDDGNVIEAEGGQRWYHLYGDEYIPPGDILHWLEVNQRWNFMCAECHSTNLKKNFDLANNRYNTTWAEINVACESCHGPGSDHIKWGRANKDIDKKDAPPAEEMGLVVNLKNDGGGVWQYNQSKNVYERTKPLTSRVQMEMCGRCHARRHQLTDQYKHGQRFHDAHGLFTAEDPALYFADGQIKDEVYVYGSFLQSKMYEQGVRCIDCHDPHSLLLKEQGNALCIACHNKNTYDSTSHHFHKMDQPGADCVSCHMYERPYMGHDWRSDHSFRIPRPDLSVFFETPNTCTQCHMQMDTNEGRDRKQTDLWALEKVNEWYGPINEREQWPHYADAFKAVEIGRVDADERLFRVVMVDEYPVFARVSALRSMTNRGFRSYQELGRVLQVALAHESPMFRTAGVAALEALSTQEDNAELKRALMRQRWAVAERHNLLADEVRSVRIETARLLATDLLDEDEIDPEMKRQFDAALAEFIDTQRTNADRGSAHMNLGVLYLNMGDLDKAEQAYKQAITVDPDFILAHINLSDFYKKERKDTTTAMTVLRRALERHPDVPLLHYTMGLTRKSINSPEYNKLAVESFERAAELAPEIPHYAYTHALSLNAIGKSHAAIVVLLKNYKDHPEHLDTIHALATIYRDTGQMDKAVRYARLLIKLEPHNPNYRALHDSMLQTGFE